MLEKLLLVTTGVGVQLVCEEGPLNILQCRGWFPQQRITRLLTSVVPPLRNPVPDHLEAASCYCIALANSVHRGR